MKSKKRSQKFLLLTWKSFFVMAIAWLLSVSLHNFVSGLINKEEPFFFILAVIIIPAYFIISLIYTIIKKR